jgi:hypothetical protein
MGFLELIDELLEYVENSSNLPLSNKSVIDKYEVIETIKEIKKTIPEEMNKAKWIVKEREKIINDAKREAEETLNNSGKQLMKLIDEHEITKNARIKAQETIRDMQNKKAEINSSIRDYANGMLKDLESNLERCLVQIKENRREIEQNKK